MPICLFTGCPKSKRESVLKFTYIWIVKVAWLFAVTCGAHVKYNRGTKLTYTSDIKFFPQGNPARRHGEFKNVLQPFSTLSVRVFTLFPRHLYWCHSPPSHYQSFLKKYITLRDMKIMKIVFPVLMRLWIGCKNEEIRYTPRNPQSGHVRWINYVSILH